MGIKEEAKELKSLLSVVSPTVVQTTAPVAGDNSIVDDTPEELEPEPLFDFDYRKVKKYYLKKAKDSIRKVVISVISTDDGIDQSFVEDKIDQDAEQLAQLYYQQRKFETMQEANMEAVRTGNASPRMFETFNQLGGSLMSITKQISDFQISLKENYQKIRFDALGETAGPNLIEGESQNSVPQISNVFKNAKEMNDSIREMKIKMLQEKSSEAKFEEVK